MKICQKCSKRIGNAAKYGFCKGCKKANDPPCLCGKAKDYRAKQCLSCGMRDKAVNQWKDDREPILSGIIRSAKQRRRYFADIRLDSQWQIKSDGRRYVYFWGEDGKKHTIYRYQWRWVKAYGPIPKGMIIHHKDEVKWNDDLSNLEMMTNSDHLTHHGLTKPKAEWICQNCCVRFASKRREGGQPRKFCSQSCHYEYVRKTPLEKWNKCQTFEAANEFTKRL